MIKLLASHPKVDVNADQGFCLLYACETSQTKAVDILLKYGADPSIRNNLAIKMAACAGKIGVFKKILKDPRVDPTIDNYYAIKYAAMAGYSRIVVALLDDGRVTMLAAAEARYIALKHRHRGLADNLKSRMEIPDELVVPDFELHLVPSLRNTTESLEWED